MKTFPRYLTSFDTAKVPFFVTDVLVIGSGIAGLRAAIEAAKNCSVAIITKDKLCECNTYYAQGGIASQIDKQKLVTSHIQDTIANSHGLADPAIVRQIIYKGINLVNELISWGVDFDKKNNQFNLTREGGHRLARILHSGGDATGKNIHNTLKQKVNTHNNITILDYTFTIDILTAPKKDSQSRLPAGQSRQGAPWRACGAIVYSSKNHQIMAVYAKKIIIASGGVGQIYRETTNPDVATGDGISMAYRAGAKLQDIEFIQFHPTALYIAGATRYLITEAVRGEGGILRDRLGNRFMKDYHPDMELAPRDIVARAILNQMKITQDTNVYLDLTHLPKAKIQKRFPTLRELCQEFSIDISRQMIPVRPSAHYLLGGIKIDVNGRTNIKNLFAAGECASSSFHGANRLGSNSLLEALVIGHFAGKTAAKEALSQKSLMPCHIVSKSDENILSQSEKGKFRVDMADIKNSLRSLMWYRAGIERSEAGLKQAISKIDYWSGYCMNQNFETPEGWEIQNMLMLARLIALAALKRTESRGVHYRTDYPNTAAKWKKHTVI